VAIRPKRADYLLFVDESGTPNYLKSRDLEAAKSGIKPVAPARFGVAGVFMPRQSYITSLLPDFNRLKIAHFGTHKICVRYHDIISMHNAPFSGFKDNAKRVAWEADLRDFIAGANFVAVIAVLLKIPMQIRYPAPHPPYEYCFDCILERCGFDIPQGAICQIVAESRGKGKDDELRRRLLHLQLIGNHMQPAEFFRSRYLPDIIFRVKPDNDAGLQCADLYAACYSKAVLEHPTPVHYFKLLSPRIRRRKGDALKYGMKILPDPPLGFKL